MTSISAVQHQEGRERETTCSGPCCSRGKGAPSAAQPRCEGQVPGRDLWAPGKQQARAGEARNVVITHLRQVHCMTSNGQHGYKDVHLPLLEVWAGVYFIASLFLKQDFVTLPQEFFTFVFPPYSNTHRKHWRQKNEFFLAVLFLSSGKSGKIKKV